MNGILCPSPVCREEWYKAGASWLRWVAAAWGPLGTCLPGSANFDPDLFGGLILWNVHYPRHPHLPTPHRPTRYTNLKANGSCCFFFFFPGTKMVLIVISMLENSNKSHWQCSKREIQLLALSLLLQLREHAHRLSLLLPLSSWCLQMLGLL